MILITIQLTINDKNTVYFVSTFICGVVGSSFNVPGNDCPFPFPTSANLDLK